VNAATPMQPRAPHVYVVRWRKRDGAVGHKVFLVRGYAQRLLTALLADGRDAAVFTTPATWQEEQP